MIGAFVGFMAAIMGVGGGFVMVPAMIYLLRVPTSVVIGTSLFQIVFVMAVTTLAAGDAEQDRRRRAGAAADRRRRRRRAVRRRGRRRASRASSCASCSPRSCCSSACASAGTSWRGRARSTRSARCWEACDAAACAGTSAIGAAARLARCCSRCATQASAQARAVQSPPSSCRRAHGAAAPPPPLPPAASCQRAPVEKVEADVSTRSVAVTTGFTGHEILVFGAIDNSQAAEEQTGLLRRRRGRRGHAVPGRRAPQERRRRRVDQHLVGHLRLGAELLRHRLDAPDRGDRRPGGAGAARHRLCAHQDDAGAGLSRGASRTTSSPPSRRPSSA